MPPRKLTVEEIERMIGDIREKKEVEEVVEEEIKVEKIPVPVPEEVVEEIVEEIKPPKISAKDRILGLIAEGERVSSNYYAARGANVIEIVFPTEYEEHVSRIIYGFKIDPRAADILIQYPSFAETQPEIAIGMSAYQLLLEKPTELIMSGYD
ncbi:MAG: hypothetical protein WBE22_12170, partial [Halobacteriota archaeon]